MNAMQRFALLLLGCSLVSGADLYVSPSGSDSNDGSSGAPFLTPGKAQKAAGSMTGAMSSDIVIHFAPGTYYLSDPITLGAADSGQNGHTVVWQADSNGTLLSGGMKVSGWTAGANGIWSATVPAGTQSRNLYVNGQAANYARQKITRGDFTYTNQTMTWTKPQYDWLMTTPGIANAEVRFISSFTDRYAPIEAVGNRTLFMKQYYWANNVIGYDTVNAPNADFGVWVQNAKALLIEGGEFYLDSAAGVVYYMPLAGQDMTTVQAYLGILGALVVIGGTYDAPAHDISFIGFDYAHTTWLQPGEGFGYVDQQTGDTSAKNQTYVQFEATRPFWYQMPGAIQISASHNIAFTGGSYTQLGSGGFGIGQDPNAHLTGVGLGAVNVSVSDGYFTQVMGNAITAGGIQAAAHHPNDTRMINSHINISGNIFYNNSALFSSTVNIFVSYIQYSTISHNDVFSAPYSGICHGYGWGSNDAGGSLTYINRGLYNFQPLYETPTTSQNNLIIGNLIHQYGLSHTDLGALYTLSKSPSTLITENYAFDAGWYGMYTDEGSNSYTITNNELLSNGNWYAPNQGCPTCGVNNANNTLLNNFGHVGGDQVGAPNGTGNFNDTFIMNFNVPDITYTSVEGQRHAYRAGVLPGRRGSRPVSNPSLPDGYLNLDFIPGTVFVNVSNFDDVNYTGVQFTTNVSTAGYTLTAMHAPDYIPANSYAIATYNVSGSTCTPPTISAAVSYTNPRTSNTASLSTAGTMPGVSQAGLVTSRLTSSTWPGSSFGQTCGSVLGIRTSGRGIFNPYDDWASIYRPNTIGASGNISAKVLSIDAASPSSKAGVVARNSLLVNATREFTSSPGYAGVFVTASSGVIFAWDANGDGRLDANVTVAGVRAPVCLSLAVNGTVFSGYYSTDCTTWTQIGAPVTVASRGNSSDAGVLVSSHGGFRNATGLFNFNLSGKTGNPGCVVIPPSS